MHCLYLIVPNTIKIKLLHSQYFCFLIKNCSFYLSLIIDRVFSIIPINTIEICLKIDSSKFIVYLNL